MKRFDIIHKDIPILITLLIIYCLLNGFEHIAYQLDKPLLNRYDIPLLLYYDSANTNELLVCIYYLWLPIIIFAFILNIGQHLKKCLFNRCKSLLTLFVNDYQPVKGIFKVLGFAYIIVIILTPICSIIASIQDYNSLAENLLWNYDKYENVLMITERVPPKFVWDKNIIVIIGYVLIYRCLSLFLKQKNTFLYRIFSIIFLPAYLLDGFFTLIFTEYYFDDTHKDAVLAIVRKVFQVKEKKERFTFTIVNLAFSDGKLVLKALLSYIYISLLLYPLIKYKAFYDIYLRNILRGSLIMLLAGCLLITWLSLIDVVGYIFKTPEQFYNWPKEVKSLHDTYIETQQKLQALQKDYLTIKQNDKNWMSLFMHVLGNKALSFNEDIDNYKDCGFIPYEELFPLTEDLGKIIYQCYQLQDAIASRDIIISERLPAYFIDIYKESDDLKPFISEGRVYLNMHNLENELIKIDFDKVKNILDIMLENATQNAFDNTVISIDYNKEDVSHVLTVSNIIDLNKEDEINARLKAIEKFFSTQNPQQQSIFDDHVFLGLIIAKINAQHMKADLTCRIEKHMRFVICLTF